MDLILFFIVQQISEYSPTVKVPLWVIIFGSILGAIGLFWERIKSSYENWQDNTTSLKTKQLEKEEQEKKTLITRIRELEKSDKEKEQRLMRYEIALQTLTPLMRTIMKDHPEFEPYVEAFEKIINENNL